MYLATKASFTHRWFRRRFGIPPCPAEERVLKHCIQSQVIRHSSAVICGELPEQSTCLIFCGGLGGLKWTVFMCVRNAVHRVKNASVRDNVITLCYTAGHIFLPDPHDVNTDVAEATRSHQGESVSTPSAFRGCSVAFHLIPRYCHVNRRWGRLHNVLRAYSHRVHSRSAIARTRFMAVWDRRCVNGAVESKLLISKQGTNVFKSFLRD